MLKAPGEQMDAHHHGNGSGRKLVWSIVGLSTGMASIGITVVGSLLWSLNTSVVSLTVGQTGVVARLAAVESAINMAGQEKYTRQDASRDREQLLIMIGDIRQLANGNRDRVIDLEKQLITLGMKAKKEP